VASLLGAPEGTVKSRIRSGMKKMQRTLVESGIMGQS
jgi:DNA-directed RNA polymerase specialized sigma24 family protein